MSMDNPKSLADAIDIARATGKAITIPYQGSYIIVIPPCGDNTIDDAFPQAWIVEKQKNAP